MLRSGNVITYMRDQARIRPRPQYRTERHGQIYMRQRTFNKEGFVFQDYFLGVKSGRYVRLTTLPPSWAIFT